MDLFDRLAVTANQTRLKAHQTGSKVISRQPFVGTLYKFTHTLLSVT